MKHDLLDCGLDLGNARLDVALRAIRHNYHMLTRQAGGVECAAAVKADAYGLGLAPVAAALAQAGCATFFVARLTEGKELRGLQPHAKIFVLDGLLPNMERHYIAADLIPALATLPSARAWAHLAKGLGRKLPAALHVDTGINRLGFTLAEYQALLAEPDTLNELDVVLVMSHLACADEPSHPMNAAQANAFAFVRSLLPHVKASLANSSGIFLGKDYMHDLLRPGIALYGGNPTPGKSNPMRTVVTAYARILQTRHVGAGESVGYGATWVASRDSMIAVVNLGYRDGVARAASSLPGRDMAQVYVGGQRCPIVGRVSMDMVTVDVTGVDTRFTQVGQLVELFGEHIPLDEAAAWANTISYELLTRLGNRYVRHYLNPDSEVQR